MPRRRVVRLGVGAAGGAWVQQSKALRLLRHPLLGHGAVLPQQEGHVRGPRRRARGRRLEGRAGRRFRINSAVGVPTPSAGMVVLLQPCSRAQWRCAAAAQQCAPRRRAALRPLPHVLLVALKQGGAQRRRAGPQNWR